MYVNIFQLLNLFLRVYDVLYNKSDDGQQAQRTGENLIETTDDGLIRMNQ